MLNKHFIKRLFYFVLIIAFGALITLIVNYIQNAQDSTASASASGLRLDN